MHLHIFGPEGCLSHVPCSAHSNLKKVFILKTGLNDVVVLIYIYDLYRKYIQNSRIILRTVLNLGCSVFGMEIIEIYGLKVAGQAVTEANMIPQ